MDDAQTTHKIGIADNGKYIIIRATGVINRKLALAYILEAHTLGAQAGIGHYLMDMRGCRNTDSVLDAYAFSYGDLSSTPGINSHAVVALRVDPGDYSHNFIETLVLNTGRRIKLTRSEPEALAYLELQ